jgi:hypothetical protein
MTLPILVGRGSRVAAKGSRGDRYSIVTARSWSLRRLSSPMGAVQIGSSWDCRSGEIANVSATPGTSKRSKKGQSNSWPDRW